MGQVLHGSAKTAEAVRRAMRNSQESLRKLSKRYGINPKTVAKWKKRVSVADCQRARSSPSRRFCPSRMRQSSSPSASTPYCRWTTAFTLCNRPSRI